MKNNLFIRLTLVVLSASTAIGVLVHDTHMDKAAAIAFTFPLAAIGFDGASGKASDLSGTSHTHIERASLSQLVQDLKGANPRITPRDTDRKYMLPKYVTRGHHAFDNYNLPIV